MPGRPTIEITSREMKEIEKKLREYPVRIRRRVIREAGELIIAEAQEEAPVKTGFLRNSEFVERNADGSVTVGFGADYALPVHERHPTHAGFLRRPVLELLPRIMRRLLSRAVSEERP